MDNIIFCKSFSFRTIKLKAFSHTDNSKGIKSSFFAKMKKGTGRILTLSGEELCVSEGDIFYLPLGLCYHSYWNPGDDGDVEWDSFSFEFLPLVGGERFFRQKLNCDEEDRKNAKA